MACSSSNQTRPGQTTGGAGGASGSGGTDASGGAVGSGGGDGGSGGGGVGGRSADGATGTDDAADDSASVDVDANTSGTDDAGIADASSAAPEASGRIDSGPSGQGLTGFLHIEGNQLFDSQENPVRLTGVNWFGFETGN